MGAFNTVELETICSACQNKVLLKIQFKYGDTWQYEYVIGDKIKWGGNDIGIRAKRIVISGISEECPLCKKDENFVIYVNDNIITQIKLDTKENDFIKNNEEYIILE
jgi:hypothetical protein